ncbi:MULTISPECIES: hypothetical protein [Vibrio]|uniref:Uncharacterized protein n=3 Tax=Vibrio harveyi group TaxID=717610 RepID=A0A1S6KSM6_9VIBR|nr:MULTISPECIES: hypothetical protein [Vibrio harveyi group]AQT24368.1 hypothetical protein [Vibrio owensii]EGQ7810798.1 hypothetical protein [Vibrio parahaemolyticus]EGQ8532950.1 hypothetical protein [Vibrio parahaemolyticus]EHK0753251.1 hypothetical protein [Vibrio parahaemolyticus]EIO2938001.1 hypothetical protein [Vibrio parahaemolyticus]
MTAKVRCFKAKHKNHKLCARALRTKTERATSSSRDMTPVKTMGLQSPDDDTLNTLLSSLFPQQ